MAAASPAQPLQTYSADLEDPRVDRTERHTLLNIVAVALRAVQTGIEAETCCLEGRCSARGTIDRIASAYAEAYRDRVRAWHDVRPMMQARRKPTPDEWPTAAAAAILKAHPWC